MKIARRVLRTLSPVWLALAVVMMILTASPSSAQEDEHGDTTEEVDPAVEAENELIRDGAEVYSAVCQACHQPGGIGLDGSFPPLKGNERVADTDYLTGVIAGGLDGEIEVNGVTYNGVMPPFSTLSDDDVNAVVAYVQADLVVPVAAGGADGGGESGAVVASSQSGMSSTLMYLAFGLFLVLALAVNAPKLMGKNDRLNTTWFDAFIKALLIVVGIVLLVVFIPNWAVQSGFVSNLDRFFLDAIGTGLWTAGLGASLFALWWTHRESRV